MSFKVKLSIGLIASSDECSFFVGGLPAWTDGPSISFAHEHNSSVIAIPIATMQQRATLVRTSLMKEVIPNLRSFDVVSG